MSTPGLKAEMLAIASAYARLAKRIRTRSAHDDVAKRSSQSQHGGKTDEQ
jgi:hypothetical protein